MKKLLSTLIRSFFYLYATSVNFAVDSNGAGSQLDLKLLFCPSLFLVNSQPLVPFVLCFPSSCARPRANPREQPGGASTRGALAGRPSGAAEGRGGTARAGLAAARGRSPAGASAWRRRKQPTRHSRRWAVGRCLPSTSRGEATVMLGLIHNRTLRFCLLLIRRRSQIHVLFPRNLIYDVLCQVFAVELPFQI